MHEDDDPPVVVIPKAVWDILQGLDKRVARIERFVYLVTGGGTVVGTMIGFVGDYIMRHG